MLKIPLKSRFVVGAWLAIASGVAGFATPPDLAGQRGPAGGPGGLFGLRADPLESVLEHADEIGLSSDQAARLEDFRGQAIERTGPALEVVEGWRAEMEAARDQAGASDSQGDDPDRLRRRRAPLRRDVTPEVRDAMRTLADERRAMVGELEATVTVEQMRRIRDLVPQRPTRLREGRFGPRSRMGRPDRRGGGRVMGPRRRFPGRF
jgi:hypothetical protein